MDLHYVHVIVNLLRSVSYCTNRSVKYSFRELGAQGFPTHEVDSHSLKSVYVEYPLLISQQLVYCTVFLLKIQHENNNIA